MSRITQGEAVLFPASSICQRKMDQANLVGCLCHWIPVSRQDVLCKWKLVKRDSYRLICHLIAQRYTVWTHHSQWQPSRTQLHCPTPRPDHPPHSQTWTCCHCQAYCDYWPPRWFLSDWQTRRYSSMYQMTAYVSWLTCCFTLGSSRWSLQI